MFDKTKAKINKIAENVKLGTTNLKSEVKGVPCNIDKITNSTQEKIQLISRIAISMVGGLVFAYIVGWIVCKLPQVAIVLIYLVFLIIYFKFWGKKK